MAQSYRDFELLIVDDGSQDGTAEWAATVADPRVLVFRQPNQGPGAARNAGIRASRGDYLAFLDADDLWAPDKLERQVAYLDAHPEVGLVHTSISVVDERGAKLRKDIVAHGQGRLWREIAAYNPYFLVLCGSTPLVRRACFDKVGVFDPTLSLSQDWDMWLRIAEHFGFGTISAPLVFYRQHGTNISRSYRKMPGVYRTIIERTFAAAAPPDLPLKRRAYGRTFLYTAWRALDSGDRRAALGFHLRALGHFPGLLFSKNSIHLILKLARLL